eukprot:520079_1
MINPYVNGAIQELYIELYGCDFNIHNKCQVLKTKSHVFVICISCANNCGKVQERIWLFDCNSNFDWVYLILQDIVDSMRITTNSHYYNWQFDFDCGNCHLLIRFKVIW